MTSKTIFAAGCFWGVEEKFNSIKGVIETEVGYIGGSITNPSYEDVCRGNTNHAEAVRIYFDEDVISFDNLLDIFFEIHNPTTLNSQGLDIGTQYRSAIFYQDEFQKLSSENKINELNRGKFNNSIVTSIEHSEIFWIAEEYHQKYIKKKKFNFFSK